MSSAIVGTIIVIEDTVQVSATFRKRLAVIETVDGTYKETIPVELVQDKCELLDNFTIGQEVAVAYNLKGRAWTNPQGEVKYFTSIQAWKIEATGAGQPAPAPAPVYQAPPSMPMIDNLNPHLSTPPVAPATTYRNETGESMVVDVPTIGDSVEDVPL